MRKNKAKNRKQRQARLRARRRRERLKNIGACAFLAVCILSIAGIVLVNRDLVQNTSASRWYVENGTVEIAAPPMANGRSETSYMTMERIPDREALTVLPELTVAPATATPTPEPTIPPMEAPTPEPTLEVQYETITITAVGDCTLGGNVNTGTDSHFGAYVEQYGYDYFFENVRPLFESDDLTIVNLEGPLTTSQNKRSGKTFNFRGKPEYVRILSGSSVEICNVANNHALDFGEAGLSETAQVLSDAGIGVSGFSRTYSTTIKGVRVCSLGFTRWQYSQDQVVKAVAAARDTCDLLIVSMHWGEEGVYEATAEQRSMGHAIIDAGADLVLGHHPHVFGGIEQYEGKYIVYSLGNFCFGGNKNPSDKRCLIFQQTFSVSSNGEVADAGINIIPAAVSGSNSKNNFQPIIMPTSRGEQLLKNVAKYSNLSLADTLWMEDNYMTQSGLMTVSSAA